MSAERIDRLEERLAWLERHVEEQDKVILQLTETADRLRAELRLLRERSATGPGGEIAPGSTGDERPPHY